MIFCERRLEYKARSYLCYPHAPRAKSSPLVLFPTLQATEETVADLAHLWSSQKDSTSSVLQTFGAGSSLSSPTSFAPSLPPWHSVFSTPPARHSARGSHLQPLVSLGQSWKVGCHGMTSSDCCSTLGTWLTTVLSWTCFQLVSVVYRCVCVSYNQYLSVTVGRLFFTNKANLHLSALQAVGNLCFY